MKPQLKLQVVRLQTLHSDTWLPSYRMTQPGVVCLAKKKAKMLEPLVAGFVPPAGAAQMGAGADAHPDSHSSSG